MGDLRIKDLVVEYSSDRYAVRPIDGLDLEVTAGSLVILLGPSGCGKTTLLSCLGGILSPTGGRIEFGDVEVTKLDRRALAAYRRDTVGIVFQAFIPVFTPRPYTPEDQEMIWGFGIGGRVRRQPLFWFVALNGSKRDDPGVSTVKHPDNFFAQPSNDQMQVLSARLGLSGANPVVEGLGAYSKLLESLDGLLGPAPRTSSQWTGFGRLDWAVENAIGSRSKVPARSPIHPGGGLTRTSEIYGTHSYGSRRTDDQWMLGRGEAFLTPNLLAVTQASVGRQFQAATPDNPSPFEQSLVSKSGAVCRKSTVDSRYGFTIGNPSHFGRWQLP